jgi:hypothetical protein
MSPNLMRYFASLRRPRGVTPILRAVALFLAFPLLTGCLLLEPVPTPRPVPTRVPSPTPSAEPPSPTPLPTPAPTPGLAEVPIFTAGDSAATAVGGLRLRTRPGLDRLVTAVLGPDVGVLIGLGPVFVDGQGWYLVRDPDRAVPPRFSEGWVAAGFEPDPFLVPASFEPSRNPYLAGYAGDRSGEFGPLRLPDNNVAIRWIAAALTPDGCSFSVDLTAAGGAPVPAVRAQVGGAPAPGDLFSTYFENHPELIDTDLLVNVDSACSWALSFVRVPGRPTPSPS